MLVFRNELSSHIWNETYFLFQKLKSGIFLYSIFSSCFSIILVSFLISDSNSAHESKIVYFSIFFAAVFYEHFLGHDTKTLFDAKKPYSWSRQTSWEVIKIQVKKCHRSTRHNWFYFHQTSAAIFLFYISIFMFSNYSHTCTQFYLLHSTQVFYIPSHSVKHLITHLNCLEVSNIDHTFQNVLCASQSFENNFQLFSMRHWIWLYRKTKI